RDFTAAAEKSENAAQTECTHDGVHDELLPSVEAVASVSRSRAEAKPTEMRVLTAFDGWRENPRHGLSSTATLTRCYGLGMKMQAREVRGGQAVTLGLVQVPSPVQQGCVVEQF